MGNTEYHPRCGSRLELPLDQQTLTRRAIVPIPQDLAAAGGKPWTQNTQPRLMLEAQFVPPRLMLEAQFDSRRPAEHPDARLAEVCETAVMGRKETSELESIARDLRSNRKKEEVAALLVRAQELITAGASLKLIWEATWAGNVELVEMLLAAGASPGVTRHGGQTLLHHAAAFGCTKIMRRLVELGLDPTKATRSGVTPLQAAKDSRHSGKAASVLGQLIRKHTKAHEMATPGGVGGATKSSSARGRTRTADPDAKLLSAREIRACWKAMRGTIRGERLFRHGSLTAVDQLLRNLFSDREVASLEELLAASAVSGEAAIAYAALRVARELGPKRLARKALGPRQKPPASVASHLRAPRALDATSLVVLGDLTIDGKLSNYEGRCVFVGGDLRAKAIYTEGPLLVLGDLRADVVYGFYNDHSLQVGGKLAAKILVQHDHPIDAGTLACSHHLRLPEETIPAAIEARIKKALGRMR